jgi:hypothetical protein
MIQDSDFIAKAAAEAKKEATQEFQRTVAANQKARDEETLASDDGRVRTDIQAQIGRAMTQKDIENKLKQLIVGVRFERSVANPSATGIYVGSSYITAFSTGVSPEFSLMEKTKAGHGRELIRGWRTMLSQLIRKGYVGQVAAEKAFGILKGPDSARWHKAMN